MQGQHGLGMSWLVGVHAANQAEVVGPLGPLRKELGNPQSGFSVLGEFPRRPQEFTEASPPASAEGSRFAVVGLQLRLVIKRVDMGRAAAHLGRIVTLDEVLNSNFQFCNDLDNLDYDSPPPVTANANGQFPVPLPGGQWQEL